MDIAMSISRTSSPSSVLLPVSALVQYDVKVVMILVTTMFVESPALV